MFHLCDDRLIVGYFEFLHQEKRLRVNMELQKLREKVKEHQDRVGEKVPSCLTMSFLMNRITSAIQLGFEMGITDSRTMI